MHATQEPRQRGAPRPLRSTRYRGLPRRQKIRPQPRSRRHRVCRPDLHAARQGWWHQYIRMPVADIGPMRRLLRFLQYISQGCSAYPRKPRRRVPPSVLLNAPSTKLQALPCYATLRSALCPPRRQHVAAADIARHGRGGGFKP